MLPFNRKKVVKRCLNGHEMEMTWRSCPRCTGRTGQVAERDYTDETVYGGPSPSPPAPAARAAPPGVIAWLEVVAGPLTGQRFTLEAGRTKIGKSPSAEPGVRLVPLADPYLSKDHAALEAGAGGVVVVDLGSTNGTFVNGTRARRAMLKDGDELRLGGTRIRLDRSGFH
jgi:hypothetical protein